MSSVVEHEGTGANYSVSYRLRSLLHPAKTVGAGIHYIRNFFSGGTVVAQVLLTEGGDSLTTEGGDNLILE